MFGPTRALTALAAAFTAALTLAACDVPTPTGDAPLRYRDQIFTAVSLTDGVQYGTAIGKTGTAQKLLTDVYQPTGDTAAKRPAIIWMHGGGFISGDRKETVEVELSKRFAKRGYVALSIDYRLMAATPCGGSATTACVIASMRAAEDLRAAIRYVRAHAAELRVDPTRIGVGGSSAGAVASILASVSNSEGSSEDNLEYSSAPRAAVSISGGIPISTGFTAVTPPILFWHGTADTVVPFAWGKANADAMRAKGAYGILHDVAGAGHVPWGQYSEDMDTQSRNFLFHALGLRSIDDPPASTTP